MNNKMVKKVNRIAPKNKKKNLFKFFEILSIKLTYIYFNI